MNRGILLFTLHWWVSRLLILSQIGWLGYWEGTKVIGLPIWHYIRVLLNTRGLRIWRWQLRIIRYWLSRRQLIRYYFVQRFERRGFLCLHWNRKSMHVR